MPTLADAAIFAAALCFLIAAVKGWPTIELVPLGYMFVAIWLWLI